MNTSQLLMILLFACTAAYAQSDYDIYQKNNYGFEEKTGTYRQNQRGGHDVYEKNAYGFEEKVGSYKKNNSGGYDVYRKNEYGISERTGTLKTRGF